MKLRLVLIIVLAVLTVRTYAGIRQAADDARMMVDAGGHTALITKLLFNRDGRYLISAGSDKVIRVWDVESGKVVRTIRGQIGSGQWGKIVTMAISPDDQYLAVAGWVFGASGGSGAIRLHDLNTGDVVGLLEGHTGTIFSLDFSPDGKYLISGGDDKTVRLWDMALSQRSQVHVFQGQTESVIDVEFSHDGKRVISASDDNTLKLWDIASREQIRELDKRYTDGVMCIAFSPDGKHLVSGGSNRGIYLWDAVTGAFIKKLHTLETYVADLSFSPDGKRLLNGSSGLYNYILAVPSGEVITRGVKHNDIVFGTAFSPNGKVVATSGGDKNQIHLWNPENGQIIKTLSGKGRSVWSVGFARDGKSIAFGSDFVYKGTNQIGPLKKVFSLKSDDPFAKVGAAYRGDLKDESQYLGAVETFQGFTLKTEPRDDSNLQILQDEKVIRTIKKDNSSGLAHKCYSFTHDGRYIVSGGSHGPIQLYDRETGNRVSEFEGHLGDVWSVAVSPDNKLLVSGSADQTIKLWDIKTGVNLLTIFVADDDEWMAWRLDNYYSSSLNGDKYLGWHINRGANKAAEYYTASQFQKAYYQSPQTEYDKIRSDLDTLTEMQNAISKILDNKDELASSAIRCISAEGESKDEKCKAVIEAARKEVEANKRKKGDSIPQASAPANISNPAAVEVLRFIPPAVFIRYPEKDESKVETEYLMVNAEAKAVADTLPVTEIKVLLNGVQVGSASGNRWEGQVRLKQDENTLAVIAANEKAVSEPEVRKITYTGRRAEAKPNLVLLAIGVKAYQNKDLSLGFADQDALKMAAMFKAQEGVLFNRVHAEILTNEQVTREEVIDKLDWMKRQSSQGDLVVLFLSGHGSLSKGNYYFWTHKHDPLVNPERYDLKWSTLIDGLTAVPGTKPILFVDSCRAAAATGARRKGDEGLTEALKDLKQNYQGVVFFAASKDNEDSIEMDSLGHGAFTYSLLEGLKGNADVPPKDQIVYINELGNWVRAQVRKLTGEKQHAVYEEPPEKSGFQPFPIFVLPKR